MSADLSQLAGEMLLRPGAVAGAAIHSTRPDVVPRLTQGRPAADVPALLGAVFTLCAHAHRWTSRRAVQAAMGQAEFATETDLQAHRLATAREQLLRLGHDWPRLLPRPARAVTEAPGAMLRGCPVLAETPAPAERLAALSPWLAQAWLGCTPAAWLAAFDEAPEAWPLRWAQAGHGALAALLKPQIAACLALDTPGPQLTWPGQAHQAMPALALSMSEVPGFCGQPSWQGEVPDTGPWSRQQGPGTLLGRTAWSRLIARVVDLLRLAEPGGADWLGHGALSLGAGQGIAWTEMARGLLVHWVCLDGDHAHPRVVACRVLAPTEWNFHPQGVLARALQALPPAPASAAAATRLAVAFDPCVSFRITPAAQPGEDGPITTEHGKHA